MSCVLGTFISVVTAESGHLYSCSMDGEIKLWSVLSPASPPTCLRTALQTGPTGAGADLGGGGLAASLEHELVTVRKLVFSSPWLYAGDEMGGLCQWTADLSDCRLKKEYYTEIWSLALTDGGRTVLTARDNEIIAAELTGSSTVLVSFTLPGRAPVVMDNTENIMVCPNRGGMDIIVRRRQDNRYVESQVLRRHDMIINSLLVRGDTLLSAGWDARVAVWVTGTVTNTSTHSHSLSRDRRETSTPTWRMSSSSPTSTPCVRGKGSRTTLEGRKVTLSNLQNRY